MNPDIKMILGCLIVIFSLSAGAIVINFGCRLGCRMIEESQSIDGARNRNSPHATR